MMASAGPCSVCIFLAASVLFGQAICVPDPIEAERLEGVVLFQAGSESNPLPDATVAIAKYATHNAPPVAKAITGSDGHFSIGGARPGRYWLSVEHKSLIGYKTEVRLRPRHNRRTAFLIATLRNDPNKYCGGASIELSPVVDHACRSLEYGNQNQIDYGPLAVRQVNGIAMDMGGTPIPRTCIGLFTEPDHRLVSAVETDTDGSFAFGGVKAGRYRLVGAYDHFGVANVLLDVVSWPSGGIFGNRSLAVHLRPRSIDVTSFIDYGRR